MHLQENRNVTCMSNIPTMNALPWQYPTSLSQIEYACNQPRHMWSPSLPLHIDYTYKDYAVLKLRYKV